MAKSKAAGAAAKGASTASFIEAGASVASTAISTIAQVSDANQRRRFEQNFAALSADQQQALERELMNSTSASERLRTLAEYLTVLNTKRINNLVNKYADEEKRKRLNLILIASGLGLAAIIIVYVVTKD